MRIVTAFVHPPIPQRSFDWLAMYDTDDGDSHRKGWGATREEAIADLLAEHGQCPRCAMPPTGKAAQWPDCQCYFND